MSFTTALFTILAFRQIDINALNPCAGCTYLKECILNSTNETVLVTGGAGFIGSHLVEALLNQTDKCVVVVDNFLLGDSQNLEQTKGNFDRIDVYRIDASNFAAMSEIAQNHQIQTIFDLAVVPLPTSLAFPDYTIRTNVELTTTACELVRQGYAEKLVHCSSSEVYGTAHFVPMTEDHPLDPLTPYAASKAAGDQIVSSYVKTFGISAVVVRPFNNYGPRQNTKDYAGLVPTVIQNILRGKPITISGDGSQTRDYVFVRDTAAALVDIEKNDEFVGEVYNLGTGIETSVNEIVDLISSCMSSEGQEIQLGNSRAGDVVRHCAGSQKSVQKFGLSLPSISALQVNETIAWYAENLE